MINELQILSDGLRSAGVQSKSWHREYGEIPRIKRDAPCIRIVLEGDQVPLIESLSSEKGKNIRKFGSNQDSFPAMNITPLFKIPKEREEVKVILQRCFRGEDPVIDVDQVKSWCTLSNWTERFVAKYKRCISSRPRGLQKRLESIGGFAPLTDLVLAVQAFEDPMTLRIALEAISFKMIENRTDAATALRVLFDTGKGSTNLSVVLDTFDLEDQGYSTTTPRFTNGLNAALLLADQREQEQRKATVTDAFGKTFAPLNEPMPTVKLAAGFSITLRTMFKGQPCQYRYGEIENGSYPISKEKREELKAVLEWVSAEEKKDITWLSTKKDEVLYVFPSRLHGNMASLTSIYGQSAGAGKGEALFKAEARRFTEYITELRLKDPDYYPDVIQLLYLKKLDKARTKVVNTHNTTPERIIRQSEQWQAASDNIPSFCLGELPTPFPLSISSILNRVWKMGGTAASDKHRATAVYHGLDMFFEPEIGSVDRDLRDLVSGTTNLAVYAGQYVNTRTRVMPKKILERLKESLALMGMLLYWKGSRKEVYMNEYSYLLGQLLKVSDSLHELYCLTVREGQLPPQLAGGSMYTAAAEFPQRCLAQLGQRMLPYLNWARTHRDAKLPQKKDEPEGKRGPTAGYYLYLYMQIADQLKTALTEHVRFSDMEKAQLFVGYLASFPKKENTD